ncbi:MAG: nucleoside monophosphate kinase [Candidatus Bostrichicola ureolyticus]|nr:MAG: nucleoside monophosphate kinase [Candidatus Bostrichicola ureolyticus]
MKHIILLGPPGCGKGTQSKIIMNKLGFIHFSTGDIIRKNIQNFSYYINNGLLVPDDIITNLIKDKIKEKIYNKIIKGIIYDGYPRTLKQAKSLDKIFKDFFIENSITCFLFYIDDITLINRLSNRGRNDDLDKNIIKKRIEEYNKKTIPVLKYYEQKYNCFKLNAKKTINEISNDLEKIIK